jgi:plastocyanin
VATLGAKTLRRTVSYMITSAELRASQWYGWRALVLVCGAIVLALVSMIALVQREREAAAVAVVVAIGLAAVALGRKRLGPIVLALAFADTAFFMVPAAVSGLAHHDPLRATAVTVVLSAASLFGLVALGAPLVGAGAASARAVAGGAVVVVVLVFGGWSLIGSGHGTTLSGTVLRLGARDTTFSTRQLVATAGPVTVRFTNHDLFWHTFTVRDLNINLEAPVGGTRQATFEVRPGTYRFVCRIPGHERAGMKGTLVIR